MGFCRQVRTKLLAAAVVFAVAQPALMHAATWNQISTAKSPTARTGCAMTYDPVSQKIVMFGGLGANSNLNDTWTFDGTNWTKVNTAVAPPVRNGATMAYDKTTQKLILFGGFDTSTYLQDTWLWDGATSTWSQAVLTKSPPRATGAMLFTDPKTGRAMMFGGYNANNVIPVYSNTWQWNGTLWKKLNPSVVPYPRAWGTATLDAVRHNIVLTGGTGDTIRADNTWTWDGVNWTMQSPATQVEAFIEGASAFDPASRTAIVFGGVAETWSWTGTNWVQIVPNASPSARSGMGMAYDPVSKQTIIFGGQLATGSLTNETWQLVPH
jgi:hypothetical protein